MILNEKLKIRKSYGRFERLKLYSSKESFDHFENGANYIPNPLLFVNGNKVRDAAKCVTKTSHVEAGYKYNKEYKNIYLAGAITYTRQTNTRRDKP